LRGRALEALQRDEEAAAAYERARELVPHAQAPAVALMTLALRVGNHQGAVEFADHVRHAPDDLLDPWWEYVHGDFRFFAARMAALRRSVTP
jgi:hypothetical protein